MIHQIQTKQLYPPPFGSDFNPHTNPIDPNSPYQAQPQPTPVSPPPQAPPLNTPDTPENPEALTYLKKFLTKLLKRQNITLRIPVLALIAVMVGVGGFGVGFKSG